MTCIIEQLELLNYYCAVVFASQSISIFMSMQFPLLYSPVLANKRACSIATGADCRLYSGCQLIAGFLSWTCYLQRQPNGNNDDVFLSAGADMTVDIAKVGQWILIRN